MGPLHPSLSSTLFVMERLRALNMHKKTNTHTHIMRLALEVGTHTHHTQWAHKAALMRRAFDQCSFDLCRHKGARVVMTLQREAASSVWTRVWGPTSRCESLCECLEHHLEMAKSIYLSAWVMMMMIIVRSGNGLSLANTNLRRLNNCTHFGLHHPICFRALHEIFALLATKWTGVHLSSIDPPQDPVENSNQTSAMVVHCLYAVI